MKRQNIRKASLIISLLLFPITMWYFSPYLIIQGAFEHIVNGSAIVFLAMTVGAMFFGRAFCAYLCPMGGLQECTTLVNDKPVKKHWNYRSKYVIWGIWIIAIIATCIMGKGSWEVDFLYMTDHGISISDIRCYIIYYGVIFLILIPAIIAGKRYACHYFCWMAPFMILGEKIGTSLRLPQLHIEKNQSQCKSCKLCNRNCPMGIDIMESVQSGKEFGAECINCGACIDKCPNHVLNYSMKVKGGNDGKRK